MMTLALAQSGRRFSLIAQASLMIKRIGLLIEPLAFDGAALPRKENRPREVPEAGGL